MSAANQVRVIGWREKVGLPAWGLRRVRAKIDTGARTSAIDVASVEELPDGRIRFEVVSRLLPTRKTRWVEATAVRTSNVKPSHGKAQQRHVCLTTVRIGDVDYPVEISLVRRTGMLCRMLIGRRALKDVFLVDASRKNLLPNTPTKLRNKGPAKGTE